MHSAQLAGVDIVVGTPAKMQSLSESRDLVLSQIRFFVLDEADALVAGDHYAPVGLSTAHSTDVVMW